MPITQQMKEDLAAAYRICAAHGFNEGVCNHLTISFADDRASRGSASLVIAHGWDWKSTGQLASLMGAIKIEHRGGQNHAPTHADIAARYQAAFGQPLPA